MDIYVYSDESGVFDVAHNKYFVYGGLLFPSKEDKDSFVNKYLHAERCLRAGGKYAGVKELKASAVSNADKQKLYRATNQCFRFGIIVNQKRLLPRIFADKKTKQRYLDYAFKIGLKRYLEQLISEGQIDPGAVRDITVQVDEHSTATNGRYELREALLNEFKSGTYNATWDTYYPPLFPQMNSLDVQYMDSSKKPLIRAADIIANKVYHAAITERADALNMFVTILP